MQWWQAVVMGIVEGVTEFLPVSSTGHMILVAKLFGIADNEFVKSFEIVVQLGAIAAVLWLYLQKLWQRKEWWGRILASFAVSGVIGFLFYKLIKQFLLANTTVVVVSLFLGGVAMILMEKVLRKRKCEGEIGDLSFGKAVMIGLAQSLAMIPGVSRSMSTIVGAMAVGLSRKAAVEYSFLLALPTMLAASGLDFWEVGWRYSASEYANLAVGMLAAFVTALVVVKAFVVYVQKNDLSVFGWYRILVAIAYIMLV